MHQHVVPLSKQGEMLETVLALNGRLKLKGWRRYVTGLPTSENKYNKTKNNFCSLRATQLKKD